MRIGDYLYSGYGCRGTGHNLYPGVILEGGTVIGRNCIIGANSRLVDASLG